MYSLAAVGRSLQPLMEQMEKLIWSFFPGRTNADVSDQGWYNFTTPQLIPDQDGDGLKDLLIANGGNPKAAAGDPDRPAGRLLGFKW